jgi:hypothetical protein
VALALIAEPLRRAVALLSWIVVSVVLSGCFSATFNVRAARAFSNEEAIPEVVLDRAQDLIASRKLVSKLLLETKYTPADPWIDSVGLEGPEASRLRHEVLSEDPYKSGELEVPIVKLYRLHLERLAYIAAAPRGRPAAFPNVLAAVATIAPGAKDLETRFRAFDEASARHEAAIVAEWKVLADLKRRGVALPPYAPAEPAELTAAKEATASADRDATEATNALVRSIEGLGHADLSDPMADRIARDGIAVLSVALRVTLEGQALVSTIETQYARASESASRVIFGPRPADVDAELGLVDVEPRMKGYAARATRDATVLEHATAALAKGLRVAPESAAGFALRESIVDQVLGVQWDALHAHVRFDGEVMFYHQLGTNGISGNYTGRTHRLDYSVAPIVTLGGRAMLAFDWLHVQDAASLNGSFQTDRFYSANGSITGSGSLAQQLGLKGVASDVVDLAADLLGVRTRVKNARFTTGEVTEIAVDPKNGRDVGVLGRAPLQISYTQVDVAYNTAFLLPPEVVGAYWIEELLVGFRYMGYRLPRVLYELKDVAPPGSKSQDFRFDRESPAQKLSSNYYMGGATFRFGQGEEHRISLYGDVGFYGGAGTSRYTFSPTEAREPAAMVLDGSLGLGARVRLTPPKNPFRILLEAQYHGEIVYQAIISALRATATKDGTTYTIDKKVDFGGTDLFHGPRLQIVGVF